MSELALILIMCLILFSMNLIINLVSLLAFTIAMVYWLYSNGYTTWGGVMMLIVFLTGLFIIFSYITSTVQTKKEEDKLFKLVPSILLFFILIFLKEEEEMQFKKFFHFFSDWSLGSFFFIIFMLITIVIFMRSTYSKGGALRSKF